MRKYSCILAAVMALFVVSCSSKDSPAWTVGVKTDALDSSLWEASKWISAADAPVVQGKIGGDNYRSADGASWFVSTVRNERKVVSAKWMTAGLGVYDLFLNGNRVGEEFLKPGFTHYEKTKRSFTYDITRAFVKRKGAENVLSVQVTPGWWADKIVTPGGNDGMVGKKCAFRGVLQLLYDDGSEEVLGTNCEDWVAGIAGPVKHAAIFDGEEYDARELPGYMTPELLSTPEINTEFSGEILPSEGAEIYMRWDLSMLPIKTYTWEGTTGKVDSEDKNEVEHGTVVIKKEFSLGEPVILNPGETLVVDFGQNCAGVPSFVFKAAEGTHLVCLPGEVLNDGNGAEARGMDGPEGSVHRRNLRAHPDWIRLDYIFGPGEKYISFNPTCTFFGYRYISVTADAQVDFALIESIPVTSIAKDMEIGRIKTGNELVNKLISNTLWGQRSNYLSVPTDCPQRDERLGWMADTQVFTETGTFFANTDAFFHKWTRDVRDTQNSLGGLPGVAPMAQYGAEPNSMMRLGWADAGVIVPWTVYKQFGDTAIIDENWDAMSLFINHVAEAKYDHAALREENGNYQWADWVGYEPLESCSGRAFVNPETRSQAEEYWSYLGACYWVMDAGMMKDMAKATGRDASYFERMEREARNYVRSRFLTPEGNFKLEILNTMQTPALFALYNGIPEGSAKEAMIERLRQNFADHDNCLQTGFLGTSILMETLTANGMSDIAYELLFQRKNPSWIYSIDNGATTIWERWNSYMADKGMGPSGMNSFNHYAYGCVCQWIWERAAGIAADRSVPGFKHIIMSPVVDKRLGSIDAVYDSASGRISSSWKFEGDTWVWTFTIPEGATATVTLPGETTGKEYAAGTYTITK